MEFPAGSTYLIPSSCITHSNTPTQIGEWRASFTQYTAEGIFHWVGNGFQTDGEMESQDKKKHTRIIEARKDQWGKGDVVNYGPAARTPVKAPIFIV